jgi:hypothetical protein
LIPFQKTPTLIDLAVRLTARRSFDLLVQQSDGLTHGRKRPAEIIRAPQKERLFPLDSFFERILLAGSGSVTCARN